MRRGQSSRTAEFVAYNRALGSLAPVVPGFCDPLAERFLSPRWAKRVARARARLPREPLPVWFRGMGVFNQFRTVVLDHALDWAWPVEQLVIVGAGLDSRAWRLPALDGCTVFEVDHPSTQAVKRERVVGVRPSARDVRFVAANLAADLAADSLAERLAAAGHEPAKKTFWLWEGVTMYLQPDAVERTLAAMAGLSAPQSGLAFTYLARKGGEIPKSWFLSLIGEPARSAFAQEELAKLTAASGWTQVSNTGIDDWKRDYAPGLTLSERKVGLQWHERIWVGRR